jgi:hypothetical protein
MTACGNSAYGLLMYDSQQPVITRKRIPIHSGASVPADFLLFRKYDKTYDRRHGIEITHQGNLLPPKESPSRKRTRPIAKRIKPTQSRALT